MSRRKQSNPKAIKAPLGPLDGGSSGQDADVKEETLSDQGETHEDEMKVELFTSRGSPCSSVDSPDHIDVVSNGRTPPGSPSPLTSPKSLRHQPVRPVTSLQQIKVEKEKHANILEGQPVSSPQASDGQSVTQGLIRHLQLPSDVLYLKRLEVTVHGNPTVGWVVCSAIPLPKGSSLGPFSGDMIPSDAIKVGDLIVQFCSKTGHRALVNVAGHTGAWLALLRPALDVASRNTHVYWEGGRIWCEIVADVETNTELLATFAFDLDELPLTDRGFATDPLSPAGSTSSDRPLSSESPPQQQPPQQQQQQSPSALQQPSPPGHAALIYGCPFCGVRFSSPRTLQGHLSYYCSKKKSDYIVRPIPRSSQSAELQKSSMPQHADVSESKQEIPPNSPGESSQSHSQSKPCPTGGQKRLAAADDIDISDLESSTPPPAKAPCYDQQIFTCPYCTYTADRSVSLTRHMRIHNRPATATPTTERSESACSSSMPSRPGPSPSRDTYCKECNIQFSTANTYRCHKDFYCSQRRSVVIPTPATPDLKSDEHPLMMGMHMSAADLSAASLQLAAVGQGGLLFPSGHQAVTTVAGSLASAGALVPQAQTAVILTAPVMTPSGLANMAITMPTVLVQSIQSAAAAAVAAVSGPVPSQALASPRKRSLSPKPAELGTSLQSVAEEAHHRLSPKRMLTPANEDDLKELPLDLSKKKSDFIKQEPEEKEADKMSIEERKDMMDINLERSLGSARVSMLVSSPTANTSVGHSSADSSIHTPISPTLATAASASNLSHLVNSSAFLPGFLPMHTLGTPSVAGISVTKSGQQVGAVPASVSKCTDCNIIFYKHDNFLIHKQHYCSGKKHRLGPSPVSVPAPLLSPRIQESSRAKSADSASISAASSTVTGVGQSSPSSSTSGHESSNKSHCTNGDYSRHSPGKSTTPVKIALHNPAAAAMEEVFYKFFCIPCKIKFSSSSNLKAHKEFYCPHGKNSEHTVIVHTQGGEIVSTGDDQEASSTERSPSPGQYRCGQCDVVFTSSRLLKLHLCNNETAQTSLLRCSHCEYVTQTDKRLAEHMKVHKPTSAYRCTLCGYRGNTVRGMRMHGKMHTDNGEDFTDSHMVEYQEPPLVPIQTNNGHKVALGTVDMEAELIRLKNEPYKRRRSRKAFEKVDILALPESAHSCPICSEYFANARSLNMHLRIHEFASQYNQELARCDRCEYIAKSIDDLRAHMEISHAVVPKEEKENLPDALNPERVPSCERTSNVCQLPSNEKWLPIQVKQEPVDKGYEQTNGYEYTHKDKSEPKAAYRDNREAGLRRETYSKEETTMGDTSNISSEEERFAEPSTPKQRSETNKSPLPDHLPPSDQHIQDVVSKIKSEPGLEKENESSSLPPSSSQTPPSSGVEKPQSPQHSPQKSLSTVFSVLPKRETKVSPHSFPISTASMFPFFVVPPIASLPVPTDEASSSHRRSVSETLASEGELSGPPYCKNCDISFTYLSTFIAHKKYYCTGRASVPPSATA